jgi:hypothetical protein
MPACWSAFVVSGPTEGFTVVDPSAWRERQLRRRLAELRTERQALVAALLANTEDRERAEDELERISRG